LTLFKIGSNPKTEVTSYFASRLPHSYATRECVQQTYDGSDLNILVVEKKLIVLLAGSPLGKTNELRTICSLAKWYCWEL